MRRILLTLLVFAGCAVAPKERTEDSAMADVSVCDSNCIVNTCSPLCHDTDPGLRTCAALGCPCAPSGSSVSWTPCQGDQCYCNTPTGVQACDFSSGPAVFC